MTSTSVLSPLDQYMPRLYTTIFLVFETSHPAQAIHKLKVGLQRLNQRLPYLKGHVFSTGTNPRDRNQIGIKWSPADKNVEFTKASLSDGSPVALAEMCFQKLKNEGAPLHYFPASLGPVPTMTDLKSHPNAPVFAANYTLMSGGVVLGIGIQHAVMDATGISTLVYLLGGLTHDDQTGSIGPGEVGPDAEEPMYRDRLLRLATEPARDQSGDTEFNAAQPSYCDLLARHPEFSLLSDLMAAGGPPAWPSPVGLSKVFTFDSSKLEAAKVALRALDTSPATESATTNTVLSAIIWSCVTRVRAARKDGGLGAPSSKLGFAVNGRKRLPPGAALSKRPFLGNITLYGLAEAAVSEIAPVSIASFDVSHLAPAVKAITKAVERVTPMYIADVIELVGQAPNTQDIIPGWNGIHGADLTITSWANMSLYDCNFGNGLGKPTFVRVPEMETDGLAIILPRRRISADLDASMGASGAAEGIEVVVAMYSEDIEGLERDPIWRSYLV